MAVRAYHLLHVKLADFGREGELRTPQQVPAPGSAAPLEPVTILRITDPDHVHGFKKLQLIHERVRYDRGRLHFEEELFDSYVSHAEYDAFWHEERGLLAVRGKGSLIDGAMRALMRHNRDRLDVKRRELDLERIKEQADNQRAAFFTGLQGNVRSAALFGDHVALDDRYEQFREFADETAIIVELFVPRHGEHTIMLTRRCTLVLYAEMSTESDLDFILSMWPMLFDEDIAKEQELGPEDGQSSVN